MQIQRINHQDNDTRELYFISSLLNKTDMVQTYLHPTRVTPKIFNKGDKRAYGRVEHGLFSGLNISLSSVMKIGLSFIPGGQLAALALSVSETAYGYATGAIQGLGGLLNVATSAIGAGASWLGETVGKAATSFIGGVGKVAKTIGSAIGTVAKNVVKGVGSFVNKGFKVGRDGSLDWHMSSKQARNFTTDVAWEFGGNMAGDLTSDFIVGHDTDKFGNDIDKKLNIGKGVSLNNLASSFANEGFQFMRKDAEFRMNVISMGAIQDYIIGKQSIQFGNGQSFMSKFGSGFAQNLYNSDADISRFRSTGYGVNISKKGKFTETHTVSGGFDLSELTIASLHDPAGLGRNVFSAAKGIALGISSGVAAAYNLFDKEPEQKESDRFPNGQDREHNNSTNQNAILPEKLKTRRKEEDDKDNKGDDYTKWDPKKLAKDVEKIYQKEKRGERLTEEEKKKVNAFDKVHEKLCGEKASKAMKSALKDYQAISEDDWKLFGKSEKEEYISKMKEKHMSRGNRKEMIEETGKQVYNKYKNTELKGVSEKDFIAGYTSMVLTETKGAQWYIEDIKKREKVTHKAGDTIIGDTGKAYGMCQIWPSVHTGYNKDRLANDVLYNMQAGAEIYANNVSSVKKQYDKLPDKIIFQITKGFFGIGSKKITIDKKDIDIFRSGYSQYNQGGYFTLKNVSDTIKKSNYVREYKEKYQMKSLFRPYISSKYLFKSIYQRNDNEYKKNYNNNK